MFLLTPGQRNESPIFPELMNAAFVTLWDGGVPVVPTHVAGDKGYDATSNREHLRLAGIIPVLAHKSTTRGSDPEPFDTRMYRRRNIVERMIGWFKHYRRVATRYDKLAVSFRATIQVASILRMLRMPFRNTT